MSSNLLYEFKEKRLQKNKAKHYDKIAEMRRHKKTRMKRVDFIIWWLWRDSILVDFIIIIYTE